MVTKNNLEELIMLEKLFKELLRNYTVDSTLVDELWKEIEQNYSSASRYYHTLKHLDNLIFQLTGIKDRIINWNVVLFSLFYHDVIYDALLGNNEERSALLMEKRLLQSGVPIDIIELCQSQILATKTHVYSDDNDTNYFTDADLSILGQTWEDYTEYYTSIRKEYYCYEDAAYNLGRKKVLDHFLSMTRIYKTNYFYNKFEVQAKKNLQREKNLL